MLAASDGPVTIPEALARHANAIKSLGKRAIGDVIDIGHHLAQAKLLCGHGRWLQWLESNFGSWITERTAQNFMQVAASFDFKSETVSDLELPMKTLYLLTRPSSDAEVRRMVIERVRRGELISHRKVKEMLDKASGKPSKEDKELAEQLHEQRIANVKPSAPPFDPNPPNPDPEWSERAKDLEVMAVCLKVEINCEQMLELIKADTEALRGVLDEIESFRIMRRYSEVKAAVQALLDLVRP
jgi:hypothetical protein